MVGPKTSTSAAAPDDAVNLMKVMLKMGFVSLCFSGIKMMVLFISKKCREKREAAHQ